MSNPHLDPNKWIERYSDYLFNFTISRVNDREIAKDIIQETFFAALKSMKNFKGDASERTWLISILKRKIIDHYRKTNSIKGKAEVRLTYADNENDGDWIEEQVEDLTTLSPQDRLENAELSDAIYECLEQLTEKQATVFKMKTILNYDTQTICNELKITPSNLWVIIHRARTAMAECLEKTWL